jgi:hypothetical protein
LQSFAGTNGDGTLLYPAEIVGGVGPMPSIRLMLLRDAIEDYELMRAGLRKIPALPNGLLREPTARLKAPLMIDLAPSLQASRRGKPPTLPSKPLLLSQALATSYHDRNNLFFLFNVTADSLEKDWCAVELAPQNVSERFRFVVTAKGKGVVERHAREGRFQILDLEWKFQVTKTQKGYIAEIKIPLSIVNNQKQFRFNALHRSGSTLALSRAFPDAGDVTLMPLAALQ